MIRFLHMPIDRIPVLELCSSTRIGGRHLLHVLLRPVGRSSHHVEPSERWEQDSPLIGLRGTGVKDDRKYPSLLHHSSHSPSFLVSNPQGPFDRDVIETPSLRKLCRQSVCQKDRQEPRGRHNGGSSICGNPKIPSSWACQLHTSEQDPFYSPRQPDHSISL